MSTPQGYPDWQNYPAWRGEVYSNESASCVTGTPFEVDTYVTNWQSLYFAVSNCSQACTVACTWWAVPFTAPAVANLFWVLQDTVEIAAITPVLGNYLQFDVTTAESGTCTFDVTLAPLNMPAPKTVYPLPGNTSAGVDVSIAASGSETFLMPQTMEGLAYLSYRGRDASGELTVTVQDINEAGGELTRLYGASLPANEDQVLVNLSMQRYPIQLVVANADAANAHAIDFRLQGLSQ